MTEQRPVAHLQRRPMEAVRQAEGPDEINLIDLYLILRRRKWAVLLGLALALGAAALVVAVRAPIYVSRASVEIGKIAEPESDKRSAMLLVNPSVVVAQLNARYRVDEADPPQPPRLQRVEFNREGGQSIIELEGIAHTADGAQAFVQQVVTDLVARHQGPYQDMRALQEQRLAGVRERIATIGTRTAELAPLIEGNPDAGQATAAAVERSRLLDTLAHLHAEEYRLQLALFQTNSYPTRVLRQPTHAASPTGPGAPLILALGLILGLMLGALAAFAMEFLARARHATRLEAR